MTDSVRTITAVAPGRVEFVESDRPSPGPGQVSGPTVVSLLSPGTELSLAYPVEPRYPLPMALGYAAVFRVEEIGESVETRRPGDLVMSMGPHASWQCLDAAHVIPLPAALAPEVAVFSRIMNVAMTAIATSPARPGRRAGVIGLGLIGQLTARTLAATGFETIAADAAEERRALVDGIVPTVPELDESSVDLVVECSGREDKVLAGARALRPSGELVLAGVPWRRRADTYLFDVADLVFHRFLTMRSGWEWQVPLHETGMAGGLDMIALFERSMQLLRDKAVAVDGLAGEVRPEEVPAAYESIRARTASRLTQVVRWGR